MSESIPYFGILPGSSSASRLTANAIYSILVRMGHFVDYIDEPAESDIHDVVIATDTARLTPELVERTRCLLFNPQVLCRSIRPHKPGEDDLASFTLDGVSFALHAAVRRNGALSESVLRRDDEKIPISFRVGPHLIEGLPLFLTPDIQRPEVFWQLSRFLADSISDLLARQEFRFFEPWPDGYSSAMAITMDLDGMTIRPSEFDRVLESSQNPCTLFACADQVQFLQTSRPRIEVACHGDVHEPFSDPHTNLSRLEHMLRIFESAGLEPAGFSPPNLVYTSPLETLTSRFRYVRIGYMEKELLFYPRRSGECILLPVSFYPDHALKYVRPETFDSMTDRFLEWSRQLGSLSVLCFHPGLYPNAFEPWLPRRQDGTWVATLDEISQWWNRRHQTMLLRRSDESRQAAFTESVRSSIATYHDRLDLLRSSTVRKSSAADVEDQLSVNATDDAIVIDNSLRGPSRHVRAQVPAPPWGRPFWSLGRVGKITVNAKNGFHGCFYGNLGLNATLERNGAWTVDIPFLAANELLVIRKPKGRLRTHLRATRALLRKLVARPTLKETEGTSDRVAH